MYFKSLGINGRKNGFLSFIKCYFTTYRVCGILFIEVIIMLKTYLKKRNISIYKLAADIQEPYSTINDIVNGKKSLDNCKFGLVKKMAEYLNLSLDELSELGNTSYTIISEQVNQKGILYVKSKKYCLEFSYLDKIYDVELCKVNENSTYFIQEIARYELEKQVNRMKMEAYICSI